MIARIVAGVVAAVLLTPIWLESSKYGGFWPEGDDVARMATILAALAGLLLGWAGRGRRWFWVLGSALVASLVHAGLTVLVYRFVIPIDEPIPLGLMVLLPVVAAALGLGAGSLVRRPAVPLPRSRGYVLAIVIALAGIYAVTGFVRVGAEWATARFEPRGTSDAPALDLGAGRHAVYATYNDQPDDCVITDAGGRKLDVRQPSFEFTDNSDSIVTVLYGEFDVPLAGRVTVDCPRSRIGSPPVVRGPLGHLLFVPIVVICLVGALPGLLYGLARVRDRPRPRAAGQPA